MSRFSRGMPAVIIAALVLLTAGTQAQPLTAVPDSTLPLNVRWQWGQAQAPAKGFWLVYQVDFQVDERLSLNMDSHRYNYLEWNHLQRNGNWNWNDGGWQNGASLRALQSGPVSHQQSFPLLRPTIVLIQYRDDQIQQVRLQTDTEVVDWQQLPVYWLGRTTDEESFEQMVSLIDPQQSSAVNRLLIRALGLHQSSEREALLQGYLRDTAWEEQWPAILEALAIHQSPTMQTQLLDIAQDANANVTLRRIAISALSRSGSTQVFNALSVLVGPLNPQDIRLEALESLATYNADFYQSSVPGKAHTDIFNDIIWSDTNPQVRARAIECLATFRDSDSNSLLLKIAREHTDRHTRTHAMEGLQRNVL